MFTRGCGQVPRVFLRYMFFFHVVHIPLRDEGRKARTSLNVTTN